ncbi:hypothetical protein I553_5104 [Mycobacterium xenopi 4042]|uniref:Uncharacterized protein n=1 Tax=Mycobacterium xenopi 4042 TaxID=1299334 RepID=X7ZWV3_MYCXE|nr:hypothetical protein I553_5104 [Mycobacterium xenopi 4042]
MFLVIKVAHKLIELFKQIPEVLLAATEGGAQCLDDVLNLA